MPHGMAGSEGDRRMNYTGILNKDDIQKRTAREV